MSILDGFHFYYKMCIRDSPWCILCWMFYYANDRSISFHGKWREQYGRSSCTGILVCLFYSDWNFVMVIFFKNGTNRHMSSENIRIVIQRKRCVTIKAHRRFVTSGGLLAQTFLYDQSHYFASSIIISLLLAINAAISSAGSGWFAIIARSQSCLQKVGTCSESLCSKIY